MNELWLLVKPVPWKPVNEELKDRVNQPNSGVRAEG